MSLLIAFHASFVDSTDTGNVTRLVEGAVVIKAESTRTNDSAHDNTSAIYAIIARCFGVTREQLTAETLLAKDLGVDSIDLLAMAMELENTFDLVIPDESLCRILTIGELFPIIAAALASRPIESESPLVSQTSTE